MRKEFFEFTVQLTGQCLVMRKDQGRPVYTLDDIGHGKGLSGTGSTFQDLFLFSLFQTFDQRINCLRLITGCLKRRDQFKSFHPQTPCRKAVSYLPVHKEAYSP